MAKGVRGQQRLYARSVYPRKQKTLTNAHGAVSLSVILHKKLSEEHFVFSVLRTVFIDYLCSSSLVRQPHLIVDKLGSTFESARNILCFYINGKSNRLVCNSPSVSFAASYPQFGIVISRHSRARLRYSFFAPCTPSAARCSGVADSASLHVLTPPAASRPSTTTACFTPQLAIVVLQRCRLQASFAHWTFASPVSRTARGEVPSHWPRHLFYPPTQGSLLSRTTQHGGLFLASLGMYAYGRLAHPLRPFCAPSIPAVY